MLLGRRIGINSDAIKYVIGIHKPVLILIVLSTVLNVM